MVQQSESDPSGPSASQKRGRGPTKVLPTIAFEEALKLPQSIEEHGVAGEIRRLTLFGKLGRAPESGPSRTLIVNSAKYGLTNGSQSSPSLSLTDDGRGMLDGTAPDKRFQLAIKQFPPFDALYNKLKNHRLPDSQVLKDELGSLGVAEADQKKASEIFVANIKHLGLIQTLSGNDYIKPIEQVLESDAKAEPTPKDSHPPQERIVATEEPVSVRSLSTPSGPSRPDLHIDIQVHIDPTSSAEQIDQIFASMAKHFYGRES